VAGTSNNRVCRVISELLAASVKLCTLATWALQSQQNGAMARMQKQCQMQPLQKTVTNLCGSL